MQTSRDIIIWWEGGHLKQKDKAQKSDVVGSSNKTKARARAAFLISWFNGLGVSCIFRTHTLFKPWISCLDLSQRVSLWFPASSGERRRLAWPPGCCWPWSFPWRQTSKLLQHCKRKEHKIFGQIFMVAVCKVRINKHREIQRRTNIFKPFTKMVRKKMERKVERKCADHNVIFYQAVLSMYMTTTRSTYFVLLRYYYQRYYYSDGRLRRSH